MWLLKTDTLELLPFVDERAAKYAILSHTWSDEEITFQEIRGDHPTSKKGYLKIKQTCEQALKDGHRYAWVDTCCINKESSAELTEAINSMWNYYATAEVCYVYLEDLVPPKADNENDLQPPEGTASISPSSRSRGTSIAPSEAELVATVLEFLRPTKWFTRGWTLQELIAPREVLFFDCNWDPLASREALSEVLFQITSIDKVLLEKGIRSASLSSYSVAARMSWAANRKTTRREDRAYSLLGLFEINMPLLYGEGDKAFQRLQEEIIQHTDDQSILAWTCGYPTSSSCALLANSTDCFAGMSQVVRWRNAPQSSSRLTNVGLEIDLPVVEGIDLLRQYEHYAVLNCHLKGDLRGPLALCISLQDQDSDRNRANYVVQTHRRMGGGFERWRVISYHAATQGVTRSCILRPRFSLHRHWPEPPSLAILRERDADQISNNRPIWIEFAETKHYRFEMESREPARLWSKRGLFHPYRFSDSLFEPHWDVQNDAQSALKGRCNWLLTSRSHDASGSKFYEVVSKTWRFCLLIRMYEGLPQVSMFDLTKQRQLLKEPEKVGFSIGGRSFQGLCREARDPPLTMYLGRRVRLWNWLYDTQFWLELDVSTYVKADVTFAQTIMSQVVDVISLSVEDSCPERLESAD